MNENLFNVGGLTAAPEARDPQGRGLPASLVIPKEEDYSLRS